MKQLVFFDADGTLLPAHSGRVPEDTVRALLGLKERGIGIVLCTGRHQNELELFSRIPFDGFALMNGQLCLDADGNVLRSNPITGSDLDALLSLFDERETPVILMGEGNQYMNCHSPSVKFLQDMCAIDVYPLGAYDGSDILMATVFSDERLRIGNLETARWNDSAFDVYPSGAGKRVGMQTFMDYFGVARENTFAFGDAQNDADMLRFAGTGIAMGNAYREAKEAADYITDADSSGGIRNALVHFGLLPDE